MATITALSEHSDDSPSVIIPHTVDLPPRAHPLPNLPKTITELTLHHRPLINLSPSFFTVFPSLTHLSLTGCSLTALPSELTATLISVNLVGNRFLSIPESLKPCSKLQHLNMAYNYIQTIAKSDVQESLVSLDVSHNRLVEVELPDNVKVFCAMGNPIEFCRDYVSRFPGVLMLDEREVHADDPGQSCKPGNGGQHSSTTLGSTPISFLIDEINLKAPVSLDTITLSLSWSDAPYLGQSLEQVAYNPKFPDRPYSSITLSMPYIPEMLTLIRNGLSVVVAQVAEKPKKKKGANKGGDEDAVPQVLWNGTVGLAQVIDGVRRGDGGSVCGAGSGGVQVKCEDVAWAFTCVVSLSRVQ